MSLRHYTEVTENGFTFKLDFRNMYWNSRLGKAVQARPRLESAPRLSKFSNPDEEKTYFQT